MAKEKKDAMDKLKLLLGDLAYQIGKQAMICNVENEKLQALHKRANEVATEIEKLDG